MKDQNGSSLNIHFALAHPYDATRTLLCDRRYFWWLAIAVVLGDALLTQLIVKRVPYTEIDWETYMVHVDLYNAGERDYSKLTGPTGPLVYPAGHLHIYRLLSYLTDGGIRIHVAQQIFSGLYITSLILSVTLYSRAALPNWTVLVLPLSKRLHSIYVLRLFNDCWATAIMEASILAFSASYDALGIMLLSLALSVKMSILLYLPAVGILLLRRRGLAQAVLHLSIIPIIQGLLAVDFLSLHPWAYIAGSFDLSRVFLYKWTVNWKMVDESIFLSKGFARTLLIGHVTVLATFAFVNWCRADGGPQGLALTALRHPMRPASKQVPTPQETISMLFTSNLIGVTFARSLHYQFYSWCAQQLPALAAWTKYPLILKFGLLLSIEVSWNIFPATSISSSVLLISHLMLIMG